MSKLVLVTLLVVTVALAACTGTTADSSPSPSPSFAPSNPSLAPTSPSIPPEPPPSVTPAPTSPAPSQADFTPAERYLLDGVRRGATDCAPARNDDLPAKAIAGIECASEDPTIARVGFYLFENDADILDAYLARMTAEGVATDSGPCADGEGEGAYTPGEGMVPSRNGCFINDEGVANYRVTLPYHHVYIGILGRSDDMRALEDFAWVGNKDTPGAPTLWGPSN